MRHFLPLLTLSLAIAGCSAGLPPTFDADEVEADRLEGRRFQKFAETARADLPTGRASYEGRMGAQITGDVDGRMIADMTLEIDYGTDRLDGSIHNINITDRDGVPTQQFGGRLDIDGTHDDGSLNGTALGGLRVRDTEDHAGTSAMALVLDGDVSTQTNDGDAVAGVLAGSLDGDLDLRIFDGYFYGQQN